MPKKQTIFNSNHRTAIVIIGCIVVLVLLPTVMWLISLHHSKKTTNENSAPVASTNDFVAYQGNGYTLHYPRDWKESKSGVPEGSGEVVYLQPPNTDPIVNPHVIVKITPATKTEVARMELSYKLLNYQKEDATVDGVSAQKYTHVLQSVHGPFHSIAYVFQKKGNIYFIELGYTQTNKDPQLENEFTQIVNDFSSN